MTRIRLLLSGYLHGQPVSDMSLTRPYLRLKDKPTSAPIVAVMVLVALQDGIPKLSSFLSNPPFLVSVSATVSKSLVSPQFAEGVRWALDAGTPLELDVTGGVVDDVQGYDYLVELISNAQEAAKKKSTPIIITNVLPPLSSIDLPIVKLLSHPGYLAYQSHVGSLSLVPHTYLKFIPPAW